MLQPLPAYPMASESAAAQQRILLVENSRTFAGLLREAIEQRGELPVTVVSIHLNGACAGRRRRLVPGPDRAGAGRRRPRHGVDFFVARGLPTVVVSGVYDESLRKRVLTQQIIDFVLKNAPGSIDYLAWLVQRLARNRSIAALVVDDSPSARAYAASLPAMYGYQVVEAANGSSTRSERRRRPQRRLAPITSRASRLSAAPALR